ncbi:hypothetical protein GGI20_005434 [Coemansia sp. BCRC 34301]|nr:hypothetical protein GGI20_005434 [Coemansia sp. BCRC 34301]
MTDSLELWRMESMMRVYIGLIWFYADLGTATLSEAVQQVQTGVDKVVAATPVLGGTFRETVPVCIKYARESRVAVSSVAVPYTYGEMAESGFDQNKYEQLFGAMPAITPVLEGLAVLRVWVFGLGCGGVAVAVSLHHALGDGAAAGQVAESIGRACTDPFYEPPAMWSSRDRMREVLTGSVKEGDEVDGSYGTHLRQLASKSGGPLRTSGEVRAHQFVVGAEALRRLKQLATDAGGDVCSTNDMVVALFWRAHARAVSSHGSSSEFTYTGGPKDLRLATNTSNCLGNMIVLCPAFAAKAAVLAEEDPVPAARIVRRVTRSGSAAGLLGFIAETEAGAPDILATLGATDSPSTAFSNMARLPLRSVDFGLGSLGSAQLRSFCTAFIVHAIDDGAGGMLANICLPASFLNAFIADEEFMAYADLVY